MAIAETFAPARPRTFARVEPWAAALALVQCSEPLFNAIAQSQGLTESPGYARLAWAPVYALLAFVAWRDHRAAGQAIWRTPLLMALLGLAFVSAAWSIDPGATVRRGVWLALTMGFGLYLAWRFTWAELFGVIARAWIVMIAGSVFLSLATPSIGVNTVTHPGAWNGLWTHKNTMGGIMALGVPMGVAAALALKDKRWYALAAAAFVMVLMSTSKTSLMGALMGLGVLAAGIVARRGPMQTLIISTLAAVALIVGVCVMTMAPELAVALIGRDLTFTGRTDIWIAAEHAIAQHPTLGYGYGAFWLNEFGPAYYLREEVQWAAPSAHNGWLELALATGWTGVALFAVHFAWTSLRALRAMADPIAGLWATAFCAVFALYTMSESHILEANNLFWTLYVTMTARLALDANARRKTA